MLERAIRFFIALCLLMDDCANSLTLLSDVPTPSFIIDLQALQRVSSEPYHEIPILRCPKHNLLLQPFSHDNSVISISDTVVDCHFPIIEGQPAIGYLHSTVTRGRDDVIPGEDDPMSTFLAEIDLDPALCCNKAHLVLGLNNHHVGSYYWARSAGAGSSMEAPGVLYSCHDNAKSKGVLQWLDEKGPTACNSNDGKRSEWVNFLRKFDTVQLLPHDGQDTLLEFHKRYGVESLDCTSTRIFGISNEKRPMGSEPAVVCEWRCVLEDT